MAGRNEAVEALQAQTPFRRPDGLHHCAAKLCPLGGVWSANTREGGPYWCFVHSASEGKDLGEVTRLIGDRAWLVSLIHWINGMGLLDFDGKVWRVKLKPRLLEIGRMDVAPVEGESRSAYIMRLRRQMINECTEGVREFVKAAESGTGDSWYQVERDLKGMVPA